MEIDARPYVGSVEYVVLSTFIIAFPAELMLISPCVSASVELRNITFPQLVVSGPVAKFHPWKLCVFVGKGRLGGDEFPEIVEARYLHVVLT
ncbi:hypothetical protein DL93DRAFT_2080111 [Clavulina sp. PMI_390]|nr:hypothetical protein DL93DRAFT_2080111 [Clavulina sp. PMI_390]